MNAKKILMRAARKQSHKKEIQRMSQAEAMELLQKLTNKEEPKK